MGKLKRNPGCSFHRGSSLFDRLHFTGFYCLPAFVAPSSSSSSMNGAPLLLFLLLLLLFTPTPSKQPTPVASPREGVQRAAGGAHAGAGGGAHAGLGDSEACELERLLYLALLPPAAPIPTLGPELAEVVRGLRSLSGSQTLIYLSGSARRRVQSRT